MKIRKAIIPAAGLGTRFLPATKSQPKEMLPIVDKPCIQYLVEEAVASGITEIIIITAEGKQSIEDYFDISPKLISHLEKNGKQKAIRELEKIEKMAKFSYVRQPKPLGDGHAILCAKEFVKNEPFAVLFGDDIYDSKTPAIAQLIKEYEKLGSPIIGLHKIGKKDSEKYGIVECEQEKAKNHIHQLHKIKSLVEKPKPSKAPSNLAIIGKYIVTPELLKDLEKTVSLQTEATGRGRRQSEDLALPVRTQPSLQNKEIRLIDGMRKFIKHSPIYGYEISGARFDTGDKLGYLKAVTHFALKHKELSGEYLRFLKSIKK
ncbi:UTP--glucose-1-phosphate uridylyltransferase [Candidatus Peregrinibacteria bacterium]|nr:UTP--glucose-1-phosphate uridylyltransferase [Candidatus Peregrinibacteria bacterium]